VLLSLTSILWYVAKRVITAIPVLLGVFLITFIFTHIVPSDPALLFAGTTATEAQIQAIRAQLGLNLPLYDQIWISFVNLLNGNWGTSFVYHQPVLRVILAALPNSLTLIIISMVVAVSISIPVGVISAVHRDTWIDHMFRVFSTVSYGIPAFWLAINLQGLSKIIPGYPLGGSVSPILLLSHPLTRITGSYLVDSLITGNWPVFQDVVVRLILPVITLAFTISGPIIRQVRSSMISALEEHYVTTARAYGIPDGYLHYRYVLKNAIAPTIVLLGLTFGFLLVGVFYVEGVFGLNGIGSLAVQAFESLDFPLTIGIVLLVALLFVGANIIVDAFQAYLDKRIVLY
jgi:peptide/nickel transport system permease protein